MPFFTWGNLGTSLQHNIDEDEGLYDDPIAETEQKIKRHKTFVRYLKLTMKYMFSHVGLCILISLYCLLGCLMFIAIDGANEQQMLAIGHDVRKFLWFITVLQ